MTSSAASGRSGGPSGSAAVASGFADAGDLRIFYEVWGAGEPVVLVHGWSLSVQTGWGDTGWIDELASDHQVVALDVRGHGNSDKPHDQGLYSYALMAGDVLAVMNTLGVDEADYVGYSLGGFVGAHLLGHHPERFRSAVLMGTGDEPPDTASSAGRVADALRAPDPATLDDDVAFWRAAAQMDPRNDLEALALCALETFPVRFPAEVGGANLGEFDRPVLVVNGELDHLDAMAEHGLVATIPGATYAEVAGADHLGVLFDPQFKAEARRFLDRGSE